MDNIVESHWPFDDPPNVAVFTTNRIVREGYAILQVIHEDRDGDWQFLDGFNVTVADGSIVSLRNIVRNDPTILELADLPLGWFAERTDAGSPWVRAKMPPMTELE